MKAVAVPVVHCEIIVGATTLQVVFLLMSINDDIDIR